MGTNAVPPNEEVQFRDEAVQFAVGMVPHGTGMVRISYGVGDCVTASRDVAVSDVVALLSGALLLDTL